MHSFWWSCLLLLAGSYLITHANMHTSQTHTGAVQVAAGIMLGREVYTGARSLFIAKCDCCRGTGRLVCPVCQGFNRLRRWPGEFHAHRGAIVNQRKTDECALIPTSCLSMVSSTNIMHATGSLCSMLPALKPLLGAGTHAPSVGLPPSMTSGLYPRQTARSACLKSRHWRRTRRLPLWAGMAFWVITCQQVVLHLFLLCEAKLRLTVCDYAAAPCLCVLSELADQRAAQDTGHEEVSCASGLHPLCKVQRGRREAQNRI